MHSQYETPRDAWTKLMINRLELKGIQKKKKKKTFTRHHVVPTCIFPLLCNKNGDLRQNVWLALFHTPKMRCKVS